MTSIELDPHLRVVDSEGNVFLGSALAGKHVRVEVARDGIFLRFVGDAPDGEGWWIKQPDKLRRALAWGEDASSPITQAVAEAAVEAPPVKTTAKRKRKKKGKKKSS